MAEEMTVTYKHIVDRPSLFKALTGMTVARFDRLVDVSRPKVVRADQVRLSRATRQRAIGGGHPFGLTIQDQILLTVIWLKHKLPHDVLAYLFEVSRQTVSRTIVRVRPYIESSWDDGGPPPWPLKNRGLGGGHRGGRWSCSEASDDAEATSRACQSVPGAGREWKWLCNGSTASSAVAGVGRWETSPLTARSSSPRFL
jgi:hypothetical protein